MRVALSHGQCLMAQQFLQGPNVHALHGQMRSVGMTQVVEPEVNDARPPARRSEAMLDIPHVPAVPVSENIP